MFTTKNFPWRTVREFIFNALLALFFLNLAYNFLSDFWRTGRPSSLVFVAFEFVVIVISLSRHTPKDVSWNPVDWTYALMATVLPLFLAPAPDHISWIWFTVQCIGEGIAMTGLLSLNRSLGVVPANRGVKTRGMYRFVRHPIYCGYTIIDVAMVMQNFTYWNVAIAGTHLVVQSLRLLCEERFLLRDPTYADYAARVKWRLFPAIW